MSSVAICALLTRVGYAPILQISCRDYNRIAIQGNVWARRGSRRLQCALLSGDGVQNGDHPEAKPVFDLDSTSLLAVIKRMRDEKTFMSGRKITAPPRLFAGASANPFAPPLTIARSISCARSRRGRSSSRRSIAMTFRALSPSWRRSAIWGLDKRCFILAGVGPLPSPKTARWMRSNVPGVHIPDAVIERMEKKRQPKGRRHPDLYRDYPASAGDQGHRGRPHHGLPPGKGSAAHCAGVRRSG